MTWVGRLNESSGCLGNKPREVWVTKVKCYEAAAEAGDWFCNY